MRPARATVAAIVAALLALALDVDCHSGVTACDESVGPGVACSDPKLCCSWPGTECGTCACNGSGFECQEGYCQMYLGCPLASTLGNGMPCPGVAQGCGGFVPQLSPCPTELGCGGTCRCMNGTWSCTMYPCADASSDATEDDAAATPDAADAASE